MDIDVQYLRDLVKNKDAPALKQYMQRYGLEIKDGKIVASTDKVKEFTEYWDKRQLVRKILLNSAYGALLNEHCRFYDKRLGQSVTLCGRQIVRHMMSNINENIAGEYTHEGVANIYGDTDSCYFSAWPIVKDEVASGELAWSKETAIQLYDAIADKVNTSFPGFMESAFHCPRKYGEIIKAGRELVADRGLFITKKRYALNIYDLEGKRLDKEGKMGKIKAMGLDLKRADTPKQVQDFLMHVLEMTLAGKERESIVEVIKKFKIELGAQPPWTKGSPKSVNKLTSYGDKEAVSKTGRASMPGHVRAALNWNNMRRIHSDNYSMKITDGMKIVVCKLKNNPLGYTSIAYPTDEQRLPQWFIDMPFDNLLMEKTLVDEKIDNLIGVLKWDIRSDTDTNSTFNSLFSFG